MSTQYPSKNQTFFRGKSSDLYIDPTTCESELRADVMVNAFRNIHLWGYVNNEQSLPMPDLDVYLVKILTKDEKEYYEEVASTKTDASGIYKFDLYVHTQSWYKVIIGDSAIEQIELTTSCKPNIPTSSNTSYTCKFDPIIK